MANILLGVTGSVAAMKTPQLFTELKRRGYHVKVIATQASLYFFNPVELHPGQLERDPNVVVLDQDEWPKQNTGQCYQRNENVLHIELRRWADLLLIAPLDANTLAKMANGLCDNCLTCVWRAWEPLRPVILAPAMNTLMWERRITSRHLCQLALDAGVELPGMLSSHEEIMRWVNDHSVRLRLAPPISKQLACGDVGLGAMADISALGDMVNEMLRL